MHMLMQSLEEAAVAAVLVFLLIDDCLSCAVAMSLLHAGNVCRLQDTA